MKIRRDIALIASELQSAMGRERTSLLAIGALLIEAQQQLDHGQWLPWLKGNFGSSTRTAENYMAAARLAAKYATVANLKLRPTALYLLGRGMNDASFYSRVAIEAVLQAATIEWISADRAYAIAFAAQPPKPPPTEERLAEIAAAEKKYLERWRARQTEADDILDGPPPDLPPAPNVHDVTLPFDQAVRALAHLQTKPLVSFAATTHDPDRIRAVIFFLQQVADAIEQQVMLQNALAIERADQSVH